MQISAKCRLAFRSLARKNRGTFGADGILANDSDRAVPHGNLHMVHTRAGLNFLIQILRAASIKSPVKKNVPLTASCPLCKMASATIPKAPPIASAHEARNQYRKGYLIIGQKGSCHEKGADQLASCLKRIAVNQPNRASDDRVLIKTHAGQSKLDRSPGIIAIPNALTPNKSTLIASHLL